MNSKDSSSFLPVFQMMRHHLLSHHRNRARLTGQRPCLLPTRLSSSVNWDTCEPSFCACIPCLSNSQNKPNSQRISGRPIVNGRRSSGFGFRKDPLTGARIEHLGLDFSGQVGEPILALADGIVTYSGKNSGYGNLVEIEHVDGLRTRYAHNQAIMVKSGVRVKNGSLDGSARTY